MIDRVCHDVVYFCDKITHFDLRYFPWKLSGLYLVQLNCQWVVKISLDCAGNRLEEIVPLAKFKLTLPYLIFFHRFPVTWPEFNICKHSNSNIFEYSRKSIAVRLAI